MEPESYGSRRVVARESGKAAPPHSRRPAPPVPRRPPVPTRDRLRPGRVRQNGRGDPTRNGVRRPRSRQTTPAAPPARRSGSVASATILEERDNVGEGAGSPDLHFGGGIRG